MKNLNKNYKWFQRSKKIIPAGCSTLAKSPTRLIKNFSPFCAVSAEGSHFIDLDGNNWLDCEMAMGTIIWGHGSPFILDAIIEQLYKGISYSVAGINEIELAELLLKKFNHYQAIKFFKNGADSVYAAIRASRFLAEKPCVLSCDYHGWLDWSCYSYYQMEPTDCGIPDEIKKYCIYCATELSTITDKIRSNAHDLACVVLCPEKYSKESLLSIINLCKSLKIYTIFDEVSSGVRYDKCGVSGAYAIYPDFLCLSKGLTNGLPLAICLGNSRNILIMEELKISNAHSSENLSIAAAIACEKALQDAEIWPVWKTEGDVAIQKIKNAIIKNDLSSKLELTGYAGNFHISTINCSFYEDPFREHLIKYLSNHDIFSKGFILLSAAHTYDEISFISSVICEAIDDYCKYL